MIVSVLNDKYELKPSEVAVAKDIINKQFKIIADVSFQHGVAYQYYIFLVVAQMMAQDELEKIDEEKYQKILSKLKKVEKNEKLNG